MIEGEEGCWGSEAGNSAPFGRGSAVPRFSRNPPERAAAAKIGGPTTSIQVSLFSLPQNRIALAEFQRQDVHIWLD
jgi:hypothetical protein